MKGDEAMSKQFNHLNIPSHWQSYWSRFPEGHTILEALIQWVSQVDEMVDNQNKLSDTVSNYGTRLDQFIDQFDGHLSDEVKDTLGEWQQSGFLDVVINDALDTKYHEMDDRLTAQLAQNKNYRTIESYGAIGDGLADDTNAIKAAIQDTQINGLLVSEGKKYRITDTIVIDKDISVHLLGEFIYDGLKDRQAFLFDKVEYQDIFIGEIKNQTPILSDWENDLFIGVEFRDMFNCTVKVKRIDSFAIGFKTTSLNAGNWFNTFEINQTESCKIGHNFHTESSKGWQNANVYKGLSCKHSTSSLFNASPFTRYTLLQTVLDNTYGGNTNQFINYRFETSSSTPTNWVQIKIVKARGWKFLQTRLEGRVDQTFLEIDLTIGLTDNIHFDFLTPVLTEKRLPNINILNKERLQIPINGVVSFSHFDPFEPKHEIERLNITERTRQITANWVGFKGLRRVERNAETLGNEMTLGYHGLDDFPLVVNGVTTIGYYPVFRLIPVQSGDVIKVSMHGQARPRFKLFDDNENVITNAIMAGNNKIGTPGYTYSTTTKAYSSTVDSDYYTVSIHSDDIKWLMVLLEGKASKVTIYSNRQNMVVLNSYENPLLNVREIMETDQAPTVTDSGYHLIGDVIYSVTDETKWTLTATGWTTV